MPDPRPSGRLTPSFGASGSGKTSLVNVIGGLIEPKRGRTVIERTVLFDTKAGVFVPRTGAELWRETLVARLTRKSVNDFALVPGREVFAVVKSVSSIRGTQAPLGSLAMVRLGHGPLAITSEGVFPSVTLSFNTRQGLSLGEAVRAVHATEAESECSNRSLAPSPARRPSSRIRARASSG